MINQDTISMCEYCYRHISAKKFVKDNKVWLGKNCKIHGYQERVIESDVDFYFKEQQYIRREPSSYWLDITNRCNLDCPFCYQLPDNKSIDPSIDYILHEISLLPDNGFPLSLVGAEATTRKDLAELVKKIQTLPGKIRKIMIVTNGVNLAKDHYIEQFVGIPNMMWTFGLNHSNYIGKHIREKQLEGIKNCVKYGQKIKNFTYTTGSLTDIDDILEEVQYWKRENICDSVRIQLGVEIGRTPKEMQAELYLSDLVKYVKNYCQTKGYSFYPKHELSNRTHYAVEINGIIHRLIKWVDVRTIDMEEMYSESLAQLVPNRPMSLLLHQFILRDRAVNNKEMLFDIIPDKYRFKQYEAQ
jgi:hypothetical protein